MKTRWSVVGGMVLAVAVATMLLGQERQDRTLLSPDQMTAIINEISGDRAMHTVEEMVPYQRVRPASEYQGHFRESEVMAARAKAYGFSNVTIEDYPQPGSAWQPSVGELWMTMTGLPGYPPVRVTKLYDIHDVALALGEGTLSGDVSGELVDVGEGSADDFTGKDVTGKVVIGSGALAGVYAQAIQHGAVGALAFGGNLRPDTRPLEIPESRIANPAPNTFGWELSPEVGRALVVELHQANVKATIRSIVKADAVPNKLEVVHAEISGDGSTPQEVATGGHLYEGTIKQGANDDNSGCALTLEIGRAYIKLIQEGKLPKPKRTIDFQWVPEISGTNAWLNAHPDKAKNLIADINYDMEGLRLTQSRSYWLLHRTPDTYPSFLNDVAQSMLEYVAEITRERVRYRANGYHAAEPVQSPNGSNDAFYIKVDQYYGSSDHATYMQHGVPAVIFNTWPDDWYHSSGDTPDKQDPTQYKRAGVVGLGALAVIATGGDDMAARVVEENLGRGMSRMGMAQEKGLGYMADITHSNELAGAYREAVVAIQHQAEVEKAVVGSASVLFVNPEEGKQKVATFAPLIDKQADALLDQANAAYRLEAAQRGVPAAPLALTPEEQEASRLVVEMVPVSADARGGRGGGRGGRGGRGPSIIPTEMSAEVTALLPKHMTVLQIRDFVSGEFAPLSLADLMTYLRQQETAGRIKLTPR